MDNTESNSAPVGASRKFDVRDSGLLATLRTVGSVDLRTFPELLREYASTSFGTERTPTLTLTRQEIADVQTYLKKNGFVQEGETLRYRTPRSKEW